MSSSKTYFFLSHNSLNFTKAISNLSSESLEIKGRIFEIKKFYEGISRFDFKDLCDQNLSAEDYLEIAKKILPDNNYIGISLTQGNEYRKKTWPLENFLSFIELKTL